MIYAILYWMPSSSGHSLLALLFARWLLLGDAGGLGQGQTDNLLHFLLVADAGCLGQTHIEDVVVEQQLVA